MSKALEGREIIFEFYQLGNAMKVTAMDVKTLREVSTQCPISAGEKAFKRNALMRLEYVLRKEGVIK